jgi:Uncharacterized conserved protein (DUF2045)
LKVKILTENSILGPVIHQFNYFLTLAICTRTSPNELQVLKRHSQRVYASPSRRKIDSKGESEEITFPHICFMVDNFDEVFSDILVRDGEMVCVDIFAYLCKRASIELKNSNYYNGYEKANNNETKAHSRIQSRASKKLGVKSLTRFY